MIYKEIIEKLHKDIDELSKVYMGAVTEDVFVKRILEGLVKRYGYKLCH